MPEPEQNFMTVAVDYGFFCREDEYGLSSLVLSVQYISLMAAVACLHRSASSHCSPSEHVPCGVVDAGIHILS
jgi:hypothetical protein